MWNWSRSNFPFWDWDAYDIVGFDLPPLPWISPKVPILIVFSKKANLPGVCEKQVCHTRPVGRVWENTPAQISITEISRLHECHTYPWMLCVSVIDDLGRLTPALGPKKLRSCAQEGSVRLSFSKKIMILDNFQVFSHYIFLFVWYLGWNVEVYPLWDSNSIVKFYYKRLTGHKYCWYTNRQSERGRNWEGNK